MFDDKTYTTAIGDSASNAIQGIINLYFPNGDPDIITRTWDVTPGIAGTGNGVINSGNGTWNTSTANWSTDAGANNVPWVNVSHAAFGAGTYTVNVAAGVSVGDLTIAPGAGNITLKAVADNGTLTLVSDPVWNLNDNVLNVTADAVNDTKFAMTPVDTLTVSGSGTFNTGEKPVGADWGVAGSTLAVQGTLALRGNALGVGKFSTITMAAGTRYIHEKNLAETYANPWNLSGTGQVIFDNRYPTTPVYGGVISGSAGLTFNDNAILSGVNTYTGATIVASGTMGLTGNRTATAGAITVGNVNGSTANLNISNGTFTTGTITVGCGDATAGGILNQLGGSLTLSGNTQMIIGNGAGTTTGTAAFGTYNLSGGTLTGAAATTRGIILGTNNGTTGTFNLSGSGNLALGSAILMVGRSDAALTGSSGYFNQSGGTAVIGTLTIAGGSGTGNLGNLNLTSGTFVATSFAALASAANSSATITLGGTAQVTLPVFPSTRGAGSTATLIFNGGTLIPAAASTTYLGGLTNAFIKSGGAHFEFTYSRLDLSLADTTQTFNYGSDLSGWTAIGIPTGPGVSAVGIATVTITDTGATDSVKISIPSTAATTGKLFGLLQVVR
jgi:hypothetical protein